MMTSDSEESDYEDAHQHHDNEVESSPSTNIVNVTPADLSSSSQHSPASSNLGESSGDNVDNFSDAATNGSQQDQEQVVDNHRDLNVQDIPEALANGGPARNEGRNRDEVEPLEGNNNQLLNEQGNEDDGNVADEEGGVDVQRVLIRLQGYFQDNENLILVDSDDEDADTISDDSEMDFPMLNPEGERDRALSSDDHDAHDEENDALMQDFDQELPIRHAYLGEGMEELQGRVVLEEDATPEIPLIAMSLHLIPGQTLPLTIFHAVFQNAIRRCVLTDRLFGIVHNDMDMPTGNVVYKGALGTLAEIYEYQEESEDVAPGGMSSSFALKAKGRQRFNVLEVRRQADGNLMGRVRIRPEIRLEPFVLNILCPGSSRCLLPKYNDDLDEQVTVQDVTLTVSENSSSQTSLLRRDSIASTISTLVPDKEMITLRAKIQAQRKRLKYYSALTAQPYFVYEQYDETVLVEKVHRLLKTELRGLTESRGKIPVDASDLSFWLAQNLTMDDTHRTKILKMDSPVQRLRYELDLLARTTKVISCRGCQSNIADYSQIFSMSIEGPQGTYVNPHGFVHETLTVYKAKELITRGLPSTEASWFPGYSWTIVECRRCKSHIGWKFQAVGRLKPVRFWGLARRSVIFKYDFGSDSDLQESLENQNHRTPPNSANSEAFATVALF